MMTTRPAEVIKQEADLLEAGLTLQNQGLRLLLAEMQALAALIPCADATPLSAAEDEAETEAGFDNMPV